MTEEWVPVVPAAGRVKETAQELLALVDDPSLIRTASGGTEFRVPRSVADAYTSPPPVRPRRGRPKKSED